jgi:GNAT superfamily N-acetyltransferase
VPKLSSILLSPTDNQPRIVARSCISIQITSVLEALTSTLFSPTPRFWRDDVVVGGVLESNGPQRKFCRPVRNRNLVLFSIVDLGLGLNRIFDMPHIRFTVHADCDSQEPSRILPALQGEIFEFEGESDNEVGIGEIDAYLVLRGRALNEQESLFEAMDSIDSSVFECYEALFDPETEDWNQSVQDLYQNQIMGLDVLFIQSIELNPNYRGKGIGAQVVRETIATFGTHCGLIACRPFPLQYSNWQDEEHIEMRQEPGMEEKRLADFARLARFWTDLGFLRLDDSDFYTYAPELMQQPGPASDIASSLVVNRVARGRRRRQFR